MKKVLACALFVSLFMFQLTATNAHEDGCRQFKKFNTLSQVAQIENDLVNGVWNLQSETERFTLDFNANGMASLITENHGEIHYSDVLWNVSTIDNAAILSMMGVDQVIEDFEIVQNCDGVILKSLEDEKIEQWIFEEPIHKFERQTIEMQLTGQWKSIPVSEDANSTRYAFQENGTLIMNESGIQTPGVWDISEDGQFILITLQNDAGSFVDNFALRIFDLDYHSASFSINDKSDLADIQYFEKK